MQKKISITLLVIIFCAAFVYFQSRGFFDGGTNIITKITEPISLIFSQNTENVGSFFGGIFNISKLQKENAELKEDINKLQAEMAQLTEAKKENEKLRKDLGFLSGTNYNYEPANVIAFDPSNLRAAITVNKGEKDGIKSGMAVISEGFMIGRISEVKEKTSKIQLITDPSSAIPVTIQNGSTTGIAKGEIGYGLTMEKIPQEDKIKEGDKVITSGLGGDIPRGLILGVIDKIISQENSLFISAEIRPATQTGLIYRVIIIKS